MLRMLQKCYVFKYIVYLAFMLVLVLVLEFAYISVYYCRVTHRVKSWTTRHWHVSLWYVIFNICDLDKRHSSKPKLCSLMILMIDDLLYYGWFIHCNSFFFNFFSIFFQIFFCKWREIVQFFKKREKKKKQAQRRAAAGRSWHKSHGVIQN